MIIRETTIQKTPIMIGISMAIGMNPGIIQVKQERDMIGSTTHLPRDVQVNEIGQKTQKRLMSVSGAPNPIIGQVTTESGDSPLSLQESNSKNCLLGK